MYSGHQPQPIYGAPRPSTDGRYSPNPAGRHSPNPLGQPLYGAAPRAGTMDGRYSPNPSAGFTGGAMASGRYSPNPYPVGSQLTASPNLSGGGGGGGGFEVERVSRPPSAMGMGMGGSAGSGGYDPEFVYRENVSKLIVAKTRPFSVSGRIPLDPAHLVLFFRAKTGTSHSLDFPIDIDYSTPPALDVLIAACKRHYDSATQEAYYYPPNLPLTPSLEIANHPILDAIHTGLLPNLPPGTHLTATRDRLDVLLAGGRLPPQPSPQALAQARRDNRVATLSITLPVRFTGGALTIRDPFDGRLERLDTIGATTPGQIQSDLEWTAFLGECEYDVDVVTRGCRMSISYAVFAKTFGGAAPTTAPFVPGGMDSTSLLPLFAPNQPFLDLLPPVLQMSRGRKLAFLLAHDYEIDPSVAVAETLVPQLKGGDALLHTTFKNYFKLAPTLHYTAGGYLWPQDRCVEMFDEDPGLQRQQGFTSLPHADALRARVAASGAVPLTEAGVALLTDWRAGAGAGAGAGGGAGGYAAVGAGGYGGSGAGYGAGPGGGQGGETPVGKARVHFVSNGLLEKLVVNVCVVVYVV
ncbi:hypothetical protein C8F01DRAFT_1370941 [Mycena amicta]|nr:hypothetical protein C8F01DRAFT_1370941 [Mycena amicta]